MTTILQPGQISAPTGEPPRILAPSRANIFADRARRFAALAENHGLGDWLRFLGRITEAQHAALHAFPAVPLPDAAALERNRSHSMPPLPAQTWPRDPAWRAALLAIIDALLPEAPAAARATLSALRATDAETLEALADRVLRTELYGEHAAALPYIAAALQVYWTHMAASLGTEGIASLDVPGVCPCCGFLPVASMVCSGGEIASLRYLHCALCNTEWNLVRVKCAACDATEGIAYQQIENGNGAARAETCDSCKSYLKIFYQDKAPEADAVADDLATLALDILVDEAGYTRCGPNLLLVPGEAAA
jgi:FdhE protein